MPELPEIETVRSQLEKVLPGRVVKGVIVLAKRTVKGNPSLVEGRRVAGVRRLAKVLLIDFEGDLAMAFHFKMTGQLVLDKDGRGETWKDRVAGGHPTGDFVGRLPSRHTRVIFELDRGKMFFNDQRLFGWVKVGEKEAVEGDKFLSSLGPEPFDIDAGEFGRRVSKIKRPIKLAVMDQRVIAGVGNIYANDALWEAKINPRRLANTLTTKQYMELFEGIIKVLKEGIRYGGATAADAKYVDLRGLGGRYQEHFRVYDREGQMCHRGDGVIHKFELGGRGTYMCPKCQK